MKGGFFHNFAESKALIVISSLASIISLVISIINESFFLWIILTISLTTLLFLIRLVFINSIFISELDTVNLYVFDSAIELEATETDDYISNNDLIIAIQANIAPKTFNQQPQGELKISFPSQLKTDFYWRSDIIKKTNETNDSCTFSISLKSGITFISLRSFLVREEQFQDFLSSRKCVEVQFQTDISSTSKKETIFISTVG